MPDPTGRWITEKQWQCPQCGNVNSRSDARCHGCEHSVRPSELEPVRPPDPLDVIGQGRPGKGKARGRRPQSPDS